MRVNLVITELNVGGAERCLTELACGLKRRGHDVRVFSLAPLPSGSQARLVERLLEHSIDVCSGNATSGYRVFQCLGKLQRWFAEAPVDVCQTFLHHANLLGIPIANRAQVPVIVAGIRVAERRPFRERLERWALQRATHVICVSSAVASYSQESLSIAPEKLSVIPNGVDPHRFDSSRPMDWREFGWASDSQVILFIGRLHPQKGLDLLQQQIDRIVPRETNRRLLLVGTGPLEESLRKWSDKAGHDRVQIRSWQNEIGPLLKGASLLVLPSYYEGMPNVVLEAFIASLPVVCSDVEGSAELLRHDFQRQSFPVGQSSIMADRIEQLLDQPVQAKEIGQSNHRRALEQFTILSMVERYESIYCGLSECKSGA